MKGHRTPARRVWLRSLIASALVLLAAPALAACPEVKFGGPASLTLPDFTAVNGSWVATTAQINGQPSSPKPNQGGTYQWTQVSGPTATLANATTPQVIVTAPDVDALGATVMLRLTVSGCGGTASATYRINVTDAHDIVVNAAPHAVATATPASAGEGTTVLLDGNGSSDPDGDALTYSWSQTGGPAVTLATPNQATTTFVAPNLAATTTLSFSLTVSDGALGDSNTTLVNVVWSNDPPVAALTCPLEVNEGDAVTLDGSGSVDGDDGIVSYAWQQLVGLPEVPGLQSQTGNQATFIAPHLGYLQSGLVPFALTVTDASGAQSSAQCSVFIHDVTAPLIQGAADIDAEATSAAGAVVGFALSATDAVDGVLTSLLQCVPPSGSVFAIATTPVACRVEDSAGNEATAGFNVTVADRTAPTIAFHDDIAVEAEGPDGTVVDYTPPATTDAVDGTGQASCSPLPGLFPIASTPVLCDAQDQAGNAATQTQFTVTVHDTLPPTFAAYTAPAPVEATGPSGAQVGYSLPVATDIVDGAVAVDCDPASGSMFALGTNAVACNAEDSRGNAAAMSFDVVVVDTTPPQLSGISPDLVIEATSGAGAVVHYAAPSASDIVDGPVAVSCSLPSGSTFALGVHTVTCSATDAHGNSASAGFQVTVQDTTAPTLAGLVDQLLEATSPAGAVATFSVTASDAVDAAVVATCSPVSGATFALGVHTVTCSASDFSGNTDQGSFTVTVQDTTPPAIAFHADVQVIAPSQSSAVVAYSVPSAQDIVSGNVAVTCAPASGSTFAVGTTTVHCSATDAAGNTGTSSFKVIVSYAFTGFFQPIDNAPTLNSVKAGSAVPVKFSLGGNQGMAIFASTPASGAIACGATEGDAIEETVTAGGSSLQFDPATNQYIYVWKTEKSWAGQCRILQVKLKDGNTKSALFRFK